MKLIKRKAGGRNTRCYECLEILDMQEKCYDIAPALVNKHWVFCELCFPKIFKIKPTKK